MRQEFDLPPRAPAQLEDDASLNTLTAIRLRRLALDTLTDEQILRTLNRALLLQHNGFLYRVLKEVASRPECLKKADAQRVLDRLGLICQKSNRLSESLDWIERGRSHAGQSSSFEQTFRWDMRELGLRLDDPEDPGLDRFLKHVWTSYRSKLPDLRDALEPTLQAYGIKGPWDSSGIVVPADSTDANADADLWVPQSSDEAGESGGKKLWLPGQQ